ncbi:MAG: hypothetical protein Q6367_013985, partial [Candidatus Freyarchaeota archaeon]
MFQTILFVFLSIFGLIFFSEDTFAIKCFRWEDCDTELCPLNLDCPEIEGYIVSCEIDYHAPCPEDARCFWSHEYAEKCHYQPIVPECNCSEKGWHDAPFWGGCDDCNLNSINNCPPCGQALAWCDGCYWHTDWYPFREETFGDPGDEGGHKCPGNPKICTPNSNWCEGNTAWHCSSNGCSKWSEDCGSSYWTNEYRCLGSIVQRKYIARGCSNGACYSNEIWYDWENCNNYDGCYSYDSGCEMRDYYCSAGACTHSYSNRNTDYYDSFVNYCSGPNVVRRHRLFHDFYCDLGNCQDHPSWVDDQFIEDCNNYDGWYDTGQTRWVQDPNNFCKEIEEKEQKYRDYYCSNGSCTYNETNTQWITTGNIRNKENGTSCPDDGQYCTDDYCQDGSCIHPLGNRCGDGECNCEETSATCQKDCGLPPTATDLKVSHSDYCSVTYPHLIFSWKFSDEDGD